jgi:hypothetical protein
MLENPQRFQLKQYSGFEKEYDLDTFAGFWLEIL